MTLKLVEVALLLAGAHLAAVYYGVYVARLSYAGLITLTTTASVLIGLVTRALEPEWKPRLAAAIQEDRRSGAFLLDIFGFVGVFIAGSMAGAWMIYREYGLGGWFGVWGASTAMTAVV
jgi:uncharacterized membrane protein YeaQ/YmgE (transglycosylase-associated protein family)